MIISQRIGALDIAEAIAGEIGTYVHMDFIQFLAVEGERILCWYMNCNGEGPTFEVELLKVSEGWRLNLTEHPPGTEQSIEVP